jgi:hypothetical protein
MYIDMRCLFLHQFSSTTLRSDGNLLSYVNKYIIIKERQNNTCTLHEKYNQFMTLKLFLFRIAFKHPEMSLFLHRKTK